MFINLDKLNNVLNNNFDVFLASASFEERCISIYNSLKESKNFKYKLVSASMPHEEFIKTNLKIFLENGFDVIEVNNSEQTNSAINILRKIVSILDSKPNASFLIDITTFTRQTLLILLRLLRNFLTKRNRITFIYTPAEDYSTNLSNKDKWLTKGILNVDSVFGYLGLIRPTRPYHLIILMGYEVERASSLINEYEPSKISIGYADKMNSISEELYEINKEKFNELLAEFPNAEPFEFSCTTILECKKQILERSKKYEEYNVVISPMNNKISTICCALSAFENREIQLSIAIPALYNFENYSVPSKQCFIFELPELMKR